MKKHWFGILCAFCLLLLTPTALAAEPDAQAPPDMAELLAVSVASGPCGADNPEDLIWTLNDSGTLTFIGSGAMADYTWNVELENKATTAPWLNYRKQIKSVVIPNGVTRIGMLAFYGWGDYTFSALSSLTIADSVTSIRRAAFDHCPALTRINIPGSVTELGIHAFCYIDNLTEVTLAEGLFKIDASAFEGCGKLSSLKIPASVKEVGADAFKLCPNLTLTVYEDSYARRYALENRIRHKVGGSETVYVAGGPCGAEKPYDLLWMLDESGNMTFLGSGAIADYQQNENARAATTAPWIDYRKQIKSVTIPKGVTRVGERVFYGWEDYTFSALSSLTIADSVASIGLGAFDHCPALTRIDIPGSVKEIGVYAFCYIDNLIEATLAEGISKIDERAFEGCGNLPSLKIPASVKEIGADAFKLCPKLTLTVYEGSYAQRYALLNSVRHEAVEAPEPAPVDAPTIGSFTYKFPNSRDGFGYPVGYQIPYERYVAVFGDKVMTKVLFRFAGPWGGNCYGVSTSSALFFQKDNKIFASGFRDGASVPLNLELSDSNGAWKMTLKEFIECMQVSQFSPDIQKAYLTRKNRLQELCEAVAAFGKSGQNPVVVAVFGPEGGHALLGYKIEKVSDTQSRLYVYDSNYPEDAERYLTLNTNAAGEYKGWYYPINSRIEWGSALLGCWISYVPYADYYRVWESRDKKGGGNLELLTVSDNARIYDADGLPVASIQDGELITGRDDMFPMIDIGLTADGGDAPKHEASVWIPADMYTVKRVAPKLSGDARLAAETPFEASVTHMEQSAKVSTTAESVVFAVDDESQINMVSIGEGEQGKAYEITLSSSLESSENAEIRLTGTVQAKVLTFMQVNGVARYSGITSDDGSGVAAGTTLTIDGQKFELRAASDTLPVLSFAPNGGAGSMSPRATDDDKSIALPSCEFVPPDGMEFDGWLVNGKKYQSGERCELTENASASAQWKAVGAAGAEAYQIGKVTRDGQSISVEMTGSGTLFVAAYGENGKFLRAVTEVVNASDAVTVTLDMTDAKSVRAFLLDGDTQKPLCDGKSIDI